jgi:biotin-[acetyl-CoA-carboxylase] ligase BirA-like protein
MNAARLQEGLRTKWVGKEIFYSRSVESTNEWAKELANLGAREGTVAAAAIQKRGRGRLGREWISPSGGLWFSIVLRPRLRAGESVKLVFAAALTVAEVLYEAYGLDVETKWPNDVLVDGRKVCGILAEMVTVGELVSYAVVGFGVNVNFKVKEALPQVLWEKTTSVEDELGKHVQLDVLFHALLERFEYMFELFLKDGFSPLLERWKRYAHFIGKRVKVTSEDERWLGEAVNVDGDGALILKLDDGTEKRVFSGDVSLVVR